jgi:hypothetical protein
VTSILPKALLTLVTFQLVAQAFQLASGVFIVQALSVSGYALYTLFTSALSLLALSSDPGLSQLLVSVGTKFRDDTARLQRVASSVLRTSFKFLAFMFLPIALYFTVSARMTLLEDVFFAALLLLQATLACMERVAIARWNVDQQVRAYAHLQVTSATLRLLFVFVAVRLFPRWQLAALSICAGSLATLWVSRYMDRSKTRFEFSAASSAAAKPDHDRILRLLWSLLPSSVYSVINGQLPIVLAAGTASLVTIGEYGALSRVGQVILMLGLLNSNVLNAHLASMAARPRAVGFALGTVCGLYLLAASAIMLLTWKWPEGWFLLLGTQYAHLGPALLIWTIAISGLTLLQGALYFATISLESTSHQWLHIPAGGLVVALFLATNGAHIKGVEEMIHLAFGLALAALLVQGLIVLRAIFR